MTESELVHIEAHLGPLPVEYRRFLLGSNDWSNFPGEPYGVEALIRENARLRRDASEYRVMRSDDSTEPWPAGWWAVSDNGGGDLWFVREEDEGRSVWFWSHESWEAGESAPTIAEFLAETRESRERSSRPTEIIDHPTLGPVEFSGSSYSVKGPTPVFVQVGWLHADPASQRAVFDAAARLIPRALAGERELFEAALPRLVELQREPVSWRSDLPKLNADQIRERLVFVTLNVQAERSGDGFKLKLNFIYACGGDFAWDYLEIDGNEDLSFHCVTPI